MQNLPPYQRLKFEMSELRQYAETNFLLKVMRKLGGIQAKVRERTDPWSGLEQSFTQS